MTKTQSIGFTLDHGAFDFGQTVLFAHQSQHAFQRFAHTVVFVGGHVYGFQKTHYIVMDPRSQEIWFRVREIFLEHTQFHYIFL
jgi:hypothetical protein